MNIVVTPNRVSFDDDGTSYSLISNDFRKASIVQVQPEVNPSNPGPALPYWTLVLDTLIYPDLIIIDLRSVTNHKEWSGGEHGARTCLDVFAPVIRKCCPAGGGGGLEDGDYGDVTISGDGTVITINASTVSNAQLEDVPEATVKGRRVGIGTGEVEDLDADEILAILALATTPPITLDTSLGGNGAADDGKLLIFGPEGGGAFSGAAAVALQAISSGNGIALNVESGSLISPAAEFINTGGQIAHFHNITAQGMEVENDGGLNWTSGSGAATTRTNLGIHRERVYRDINQVAHGLAVGDLIRFNGTIFVKAQADVEANAECVGIVSVVTDVDNFTMVTHGYVTGLSGLTSGTTYFLSEITAGLLTATAPSTAANVRKAQLIALSTTTGHYNNFVGYIVP